MPVVAGAEPQTSVLLMRRRVLVTTQAAPADFQHKHLERHLAREKAMLEPRDPHGVTKIVPLSPSTSCGWPGRDCPSRHPALPRTSGTARYRRGCPQRGHLCRREDREQLALMTQPPASQLLRMDEPILVGVNLTSQGHTEE